VSDLLDDTIDSFAVCVHTREKRLNPKFEIKSANQRARGIVASRWKNLEQRLGIVGGKKALARLAEWSQDKFSVSMGASSLASELEAEEIDGEVRDVLLALERNETFT
jgi:hypothetical protein